MDAVDSKASAVAPRLPDAVLMRRVTVIALFLLGLTAAFSYLFRYYTRRFEDYTGPAKWIWARHQISRNVPVVFFATRDFDLPLSRRFTQLKIFGDPEYTVWFNGRELAGRRTDERRHLDVYDVSSLARSGKNRIVVAVRSTNGVGGLIAGVDTDYDFQNVVYTDESWRIYRRWNDALPIRDVGPSQPPMILGEPPLARWHYLEPRSAQFEPPVSRVIAPKQSIDFIATIPNVKIVEGVAVATRQSVRATAYDFGFTRGRVRLSLVGFQPVPPVVRFRLANVKEEVGATETTIWSTPFAAGETSLTELEPRSFRYVIVFGGRARAEVVQ